MYDYSITLKRLSHIFQGLVPFEEHEDNMKTSFNI